jgi:hypothetical protein
LHFLPLCGYFLTLLRACRTLETAQKLGADLPRTFAVSLDVTNEAALDAAVASHDLVVSLIPYAYHAAVIKSAIKGRTHVVTTSYVSPAMRALDAAAKEAGIVVMNEIGLDPGIDHLYAVKTIEEVHAKGGKVCLMCSIISGLVITHPRTDQGISILLRRLTGPRCSEQPSWLQIFVVIARCPSCLS